MRVVTCRYPDEVGYRASRQIVESMQHTLAPVRPICPGAADGEHSLASL